MISAIVDLKFGTAAVNDDAVGTYPWVDPINVTKNARSYTAMYIGNGGDKFVVRNARLFVDGAIVGTNQAADNHLNGGSTPTSISLGGSTNLWGLTDIDPRLARRGDFGVAVSMGRLNSSNVLTGQTNYVVVYGFKFDIPKDAIVRGVQVQVVGNTDYAGPGIEYGNLYYIRMRVYYDYNPVLMGTAKPAGFIDVNEAPEPIIPQEKTYQYMAYEDNIFRGQWGDVMSIPSIKLEVNKLPGELPIELARNLDSKEIEYDEILLSGSGGEVLITTQSNETLLAGDETSYGIGSGTDLEVDHTVRVKEYYGGYEELLTHEQDVILTSQGEPIVIANGYPRGRDYYVGYVSDYGFIYDRDKQTTGVKLLHMSEELNNEVYRTPDTLQYNGYDVSQNLAYGFGSFEKYAGETVSAGFTFTAGATYKLKRIVAALSGWRDNIITMTIRTGGTMGAGTVLGTATATISAGGINKLSFAFAESVSLTNASVYNVSFDSAFEKQTMSQSYPAWLYVGATYAGGTNYVYKDGAWVEASSVYDIGFELWQEGGNTRVTENSIAPENIAKKVLDYNKTTGGLITYDMSSIEPSFTIVSAPFNTNTLKESMDYILKLTPSNWFYYVDPGELLFNLRGQPELVTQWFTLKKDIIKLELHKNIEKIINDVLFTGGGEPALFREYIDAASRNQWRKGLAKLSDNRVTDVTTAEILMEAASEEVAQPIWLGTVEILRSEHPKMIRPGELSGYRNFGNIIDLLTIQIISVDVTPDTFICQLGTQVPKQSQRIEDIKRNLTRIEIENNPNAPS